MFLVNHPPHLMSTWSSAFIPFCAYKTDLNFSKTTLELPSITFPLCSSFLPTILEGQLCYKITLNERSGKGRRNSLMLLLDYNEQRSLPMLTEKVGEEHMPSRTLINVDNVIEGKQGVSAKVHIHSLESFVGFGKGLFSMTDVKRMTSKEDFLKMPLKDRKCNIESYEDCRTSKLLEECNCSPWEVPGFQVRAFEEEKKHLRCVTGFAEVWPFWQGLHSQQVQFYIRLSYKLRWDLC